mgnify:CR=1 FL=1
MNKKRYPDPNEIVESWKDAVYKETMALSGKDLDRYLKDNSMAVLKNYKLTSTKTKLHSGTNILVSKKG